ncbi:hypothetical protein QTP86_032017, partial [Hemibagrus guttatus]
SGHICSTTITLNTGVPQVCVLSSFLYSLFTHDCRPVYGSNSIIKFADDTTVIDLCSDNNETVYRAGPVLDHQYLQSGSRAPFFLNTLKKNHLSSTILVNFYRCTIDSILTNCITVWYGNCSVADYKALQREVKTAQRIIGTPLPAIEDIQKQRCLRRAHSILKDSSHPLPIAFSNFYPHFFLLLSPY